MKTSFIKCVIYTFTYVVGYFKNDDTYAMNFNDIDEVLSKCFFNKIRMVH